MTGCSRVGVSNDKVWCRFEVFIVDFLKEIFVFDWFHIFPPMLVDWEQVDLLKLCYVVKDKGGYDAVCNEKLWDLVGEECGLGVSVGSSLKLVYSKQLKPFEAWFKRTADSNVPSEIKELDNGSKFHRYLMIARTDIKELLSKNEVTREEPKGGLDVESKLGGVNEVKSLNLESNSGEKEFSTGKSGEGNDAMEVVQEVDGGKLSADMAMNVSDVVNSSKSGLLSEGENHGVDRGDDCVVELEPSSVDKEMFGLKRKRKSMFDLLNWVTGAAQNPWDPEVGSLPEKSKWKSYSNQEVWKQILLYREAAFNKKAFQSSSEQQNWKIQKMHPSIYDDQPAPNLNYHLRDRSKRDKQVPSGKQTSSKKVVSSGKHSSSFRSSSGSSVGTEGDSDRTTSSRPEGRANKRLPYFTIGHSIVDTCPNRLIPRGPNYQARVPEWTGVTQESDSKWLGTQIWPLEKTNSRLLIERDPIGKGRQDSCGCSEPGSVECVRFHIGERRAKLKMELGVAFYEWNLDKVGEDVRHLWTDKEEKKFKNVVETTLASSDKYFWDHIFRAFPKKSRAELVSYYFNVFLLQRRAYQNRHTPNNIDSDDDEESQLRKVFGHQTQNPLSGSILLTPKKPHRETSK